MNLRTLILKYPLLEAIERSRQRFVKIVGKQPDYVRISPDLRQPLLDQVNDLLMDQGRETEEMAIVTQLSGVDVVFGGPAVSDIKELLAVADKEEMQPPDVIELLKRCRQKRVRPPFEHYCIETINAETQET